MRRDRGQDYDGRDLGIAIYTEGNHIVRVATMSTSLKDNIKYLVPLINHIAESFDVSPYELLDTVRESLNEPYATLDKFLPDFAAHYYEEIKERERKKFWRR